MSDIPKPGDRVRVTYEGTYHELPDMGGLGAVWVSGVPFHFPADATMEVLPPARPEWADRVGTVVRFPFRHDQAAAVGDIWQRYLQGWASLDDLGRAYSYDQMVALYDVFPTILYDPKDHQ